jgi:hypothetical protein
MDEGNEWDGRDVNNFSLVLLTWGLFKSCTVVNKKKTKQKCNQARQARGNVDVNKDQTLFSLSPFLPMGSNITQPWPVPSLFL